MMVLEIPITNYIFNILEHKVKNVLLVEDLHLLTINKMLLQCKFFKRLLDNETFFLKNKFYFDQY